MTSNSIASTSTNTVTYPINTLFPKVVYGKDRKLILHFLIALKQPSEKIQQWIEKIKKEPGNLLNYGGQEGCFNLTPLAVCILVRDKKTATLLINAGADPTIADIKGWTPFHHAIVAGDQEMLELLKTAKGIDRVVLEKLGDSEVGNYQDFQQLLNAQIAKPEEHVFYYRKENGEVSPGTAAHFKELTGAQYCNTLIVTPSDLANRWANPYVHGHRYPQLSGFLQQAHKEYLSHPPKLFLGKDHPTAPQGWDVYVDQDLQPFQSITIYGGEINRNPSDDHYLLADIDGRKIRNLGPMINDGFPNCAYFPVSYGGFTYDLFLALRSIKKGERLLWNYGIGFKLNNPHIELAPLELENYVKNGSLGEKFKKLLIFFSSCDSNTECQLLLNHLVDREKLTYVLETPTSMLYLLSKGLFPAQDICTIFCQPPETLKSAKLSTEEQEARFHLAQTCYKIEKRLKKYAEQKQDRLVQEIRDFLDNWSRELSGLLIVNISGFFVTCLESEVNSLEAWDKIKDDINKYLKIMQCLADYRSSHIDPSAFKTDLTKAFGALPERRKTGALKDIQLFLQKAGSKKDVSDAIYESLRALK